MIHLSSTARGRCYLAYLIVLPLMTLGIQLGAGLIQTGSSSVAAASTTIKCTGKPISVMTIGNNTAGTAQYNPAPKAGGEAAAHWINKTCEGGRKVNFIFCNEQEVAQDDTTCGQEAVADKVVAITGSQGVAPDNYNNVVEAAGIPDIDELGFGTTDVSSPLSFPVVTFYSEIDGMAAAASGLGANKVAMVAVSTPNSAAYLKVIQSHALSEFGETLTTVVNVPVTATDMTTYAAQALASGATTLMAAVTSQQLGSLATALQSQGAGSNVKIIATSVIASPSVIASIAAPGNGRIVLVSQSWPASDPSNPGVKQYLKELRADNFPTTGETVSEPGELAWSGVHMVTDLLKGVQNPTAAALIAKITATPANFYKNYPILAPFNFQQNAFPTTPALKDLRIFSSYIFVGQDKNGKIVPLSSTWVNINKPVHFTEQSNR